MNSSGSNQKPIATLRTWAGLAASLGLVLVTFHLSTRHGMGLHNDSRAFIGPALAHLRGETVISLHHPPLFGWLIWAVASASRLDVLDAVRYIQLFATVALIVGVWWPLRWALPKYPHAADAAAILTAICFPIVEHQGNVGTDQLGAALAVWTLGLLARHLATNGEWRWLAACLACGAFAFLNRFAAFGVVLSVSTVLWLHRGRPFSRDFFSAFGCGLVMVTPCVLHLVGNISSTGHATTRQVVWNGIPWDRIRESLATLSLWFLPNQLARWPSGLALLIAGATLFWSYRGWSRAGTTQRSLLMTLAGFGVMNFIFLVVTISLVEYGLALNTRTLLPYVPISIMLGALVAGLTLTITPVGRLSALLAFLFLLGISSHRAASLTASYSILGKHHLGVTEMQSGFPNFIRSHHGATFICNNPPYFFNLTRTECIELPVEYSILTNRRDPEFDEKVTAIRNRLRDRASVYLVVFQITDVETRISTQRLMAGSPFKRVLNDYFVSIYKFSPP